MQKNKSTWHLPTVSKKDPKVPLRSGRRVEMYFLHEIVWLSYKEHKSFSP